MQGAAVPFVIYEITGSTAWLGVAAAIVFLPLFLLGPLAGAIADRCSRRTVLISTQAVQMAAAIALWAMWATGTATLGSLLAALTATAIASGINIASWQAFVPSLVPRRDLLNAVRLNSIQFALARALGPAVAGLVLGAFGPSACFAANAVSFVYVIGVLWVIRPHPEATALDGAARRAAARADGHGDERPMGMVAGFVEGVRYVAAHPVLVQCVATNFAVGFLALSMVQLAPAVAKDQLHLSDAGYGLVLAAAGAGSIAVSLVLAAQAERVRRSATAIGGLVAVGLGGAVLAVANGLVLGMAGFLLLGIGQSMTAIALNTAIQLQVAEAFRGRVLSVYLMANISSPVGTFVLGGIAGAASTRLASGAGAALTGGYLVVAVLAFRALAGLDDASVQGRAPAPATAGAVGVGSGTPAPNGPES